MWCQSRVVGCVAVWVAVSFGSPSFAQERWNRGQNVQPVFEGWERNGDGSFNMLFGYLNRNYEEQNDAAWPWRAVANLAGWG